MEFQENLLEDDFQKMSDVLLQDHTPTFMYRDFQSRNVMVKNGEPWFIDFQGGRKGPIYYDVASFLWQAKAKYPAELRQELIADYLQALRGYMDIDEKHFFRQLRHFVLFRTLQVLGAYGFRGYFEKKPHFIQSVPFAIDNLRQLLKEDYPEYPYLCTVLRELTNLSQFYDDIQKHTLKVKIVSFAYKKGIPNDPSGNGGGFVFDCRAINNPGKYERYNHFTGLDEPVIRFLEEDGEITRFLDHAYEIVDASVKRYMDRGFTNLMICFGCTGGQHRSVYSAQHMAEHIHSKFGVRVDLVHREQNIEQLFNSIMKAMIFAAGLGTRLKPLTDSTPKALLPINGKPMLEHVILKLKDAGFHQIAINVHHLGDQIINFLAANNNFGIQIHISNERDYLLDTGGGIKHAAAFLQGNEPFLIYNDDSVRHRPPCALQSSCRDKSVGDIISQQTQYLPLSAFQ